ncbi:hypothetical protein [Vibrio phage vB_VibM_83AMN]|nr:hypothetical protein [Vibrio phage vB_VibM_83AMN]
MSKTKNCPCCGSEAYWICGNADIKMNDHVSCYTCDLELIGDYTPKSALIAWNKRSNEKVLSVLKEAYRNGRKQGWLNNYESFMQNLNDVIKSLEEE